MGIGPMTASVGAYLKHLEVDPATDARGQLALVLATSLDSNPEAAAPLARELRMTLSELEARHGDDPDSFANLLAELSAPMVDAKN